MPNTQYLNPGGWRRIKMTELAVSLQNEQPGRRKASGFRSGQINALLQT